MAEPIPLNEAEAMAGFHERDPIEFEPEPECPFLSRWTLLAALGAIGLCVAAGYGVTALYGLL